MQVYKNLSIYSHVYGKYLFPYNLFFILFHWYAFEQMHRERNDGIREYWVQTSLLVLQDVQDVLSDQWSPYAEHREMELCFMLSCWSFHFIIYLFNHKWSQELKENIKLPEPL